MSYAQAVTSVDELLQYNPESFAAVEPREMYQTPHFANQIPIVPSQQQPMMRSSPPPQPQPQSQKMISLADIQNLIESPESTGLKEIKKIVLIMYAILVLFLILIILLILKL